MPELPEVETIRRGLESRVLGQTVAKVRVGDCRILRIGARQLRKKLPEQSVQGLERRGKYLIFELDCHYLIFHLGMTGQLTFRDPSRPDSGRFNRHPVTGLQRISQHAPDQHTHLQIHFSSGNALLFRDIRKFGKVFLMDKHGPAMDLLLGGLGLEPFTPGYTWNAFLQRFQGRKLRIKSLLLDQSFVAGLGNIYADEALFEAGLHPERLVTTLESREKKRLFKAIPKVLKQGIEHGGTSFRDYVRSDGQVGGHQEDLKVYGRENQPCLKCGSRIQRIVLGQRGTRFCPCCQR